MRDRVRLEPETTKSSDEFDDDLLSNSRSVMTDTTRESQVELLLQAGLECLDDGDYAGALARWNDVLSLEPSNERADRLVQDLRALMGDAEDVDLGLSADWIVVLDDDADAVDAGSSNVPSAPRQASASSNAPMQSRVDPSDDETNRLSETIARHEREILDLNCELADHEQRDEDQRKKINQLETALAESRAAAAQATRTHEEAQRTNAELTATVDQASSQLNEERTEHEATRTLLDDAIRRADALEHRQAELDKTVELAGNEIAVLRTTLETERGQLESALDDVRDLRTRMTVAEQSLARAENEVETQAAELANRSNELAALREEAARFEAELNQRTAERDEARATADSTQVTVTQLEAELNERTTERNDAVTAAETAQTTITQLEAELERRTTERDDARAAAETAQVTITQLEAELAAMAEARDDAVRGQSDARSEAASVAEERDALMLEVTTATTSASDARAALAEVVASADQLQAQLAEATASRDEAVGARDALRAQYDDVTRAAEDTAARLDAQMARVSELETHLTAVEVERDHIRYEYEKAQERAEASEAAASALRSELAERDAQASTHTHEPGHRVSGESQMPANDAELNPAELGTARWPNTAHPSNDTSDNRIEMIEPFAAYELEETDPPNPMPSVSSSSPYDINDGLTLNDQPTGAWDIAPELASPLSDASTSSDANDDMVLQLDVHGETPAPDPAFDDHRLDDDLALPSETHQTSTHRTMAGMHFALDDHLAASARATPSEGNPVAVPRSAIRDQLIARLEEAPEQVGVRLERIEGIGQREAFLLGSVDGRTTFAEIIDHSPLSDEDGIEALITLLEKGVIVSPSIAGPGAVST